MMSPYLTIADQVLHHLLALQITVDAAFSYNQA